MLAGAAPAFETNPVLVELELPRVKRTAPFSPGHCVTAHAGRVARRRPPHIRTSTGAACGNLRTGCRNKPQGFSEAAPTTQRSTEATLLEKVERMRKVSAAIEG